jgi:DNA-binding XRE family transcriptional regulator
MAKQHPIKIYCKEWEMTQSEFAQMVDVSHQRISQIVRNEWPPGRELVTRIVAMTNGEISYEDLHEWNPPRKRKAGA